MPIIIRLLYCWIESPVYGEGPGDWVKQIVARHWQAVECCLEDLTRLREHWKGLLAWVSPYSRPRTSPFRRFKDSACAWPEIQKEQVWTQCGPLLSPFGECFTPAKNIWGQEEILRKSSNQAKSWEMTCVGTTAATCSFIFNSYASVL